MSKRLSFESITRPDGSLPPGRCVFLSVEGVTERDYFQLVNAHEKELRLPQHLHIEILGRKKADTCSAPTQVLELLKNYIELRESENLSQYLQDIIPKKYDDEFVQQYLDDSNAIIDAEMKSAFEADLEIAGIDLNYSKYLKSKQNEDTDVFGVVFDRDIGCHTVSQIRTVIEYCNDKGYCCLISNPCFDFWLLLHLSNVKDEYKDCLDDIRQNQRVSNEHTFVSKKVSEKTHHRGKTLPEETFKKYYLGKIDTAIEHAKNFSRDPEDLLDNVGTGIPQLFALLRGQP